ncbi:MAG TPA: hypothetical protein VGH27_02545 [Streptosporangiaceae bacterium]|jgi:hypothetical protein
MTLPRRLRRDTLIARMLRAERTLTVTEILDEMHRAHARVLESGEFPAAVAWALDAQFRDDVEIVRWIGGLRNRSRDQ